MTISTPLVSVLMTAYNRENYVAEAIESVLASTYSNFELLVVDDCSKDKTVSVAKSFADNDKRVTVFVNEQNIGDYPNRNKAASLAKGDFIMFVDSDDMIFRNGIASCVSLMQQYPESAMGIRIFNRKQPPSIISTDNAIRKHFFEEPFLGSGPGGTIIRRVFFEQVGGFPEKYGPANDRYFNLKVACNTPLVLIPFEFLNYRIHNEQEQNNRFGYLYNNYLYLKDALEELPFPLKFEEKRWLQNKNKRRFMVNVVRYFRDTLNIRKTREALRQAQFGWKDIGNAIFQ